MTTTSADYTITPEREAEIRSAATAWAHRYAAAGVGLATAPISERAQVIGAEVAGLSVATQLLDTEDEAYWRQALCREATMRAVDELVRAMVPLESEAAACRESLVAAADEG